MNPNIPAEIADRIDAMLELVKAGGALTDPRVEAAFRAVPRHHFLPMVPLDEVYSDRAILTKSLEDRPASSSSQPSMMAIMLEQLDLQPGHRVLEIGAGTGYNAALMAQLAGEAGQVVTIDIDEDIVRGAREHLAAAGYDRVLVVCADGGYGYPQAAPFDRIILTASADEITPAWLEQLRPGGRIVLPLSLRGQQNSVAFTHTGDHLESLSVRPCGFMPLRGAFSDEWERRIALDIDSKLFLMLQEALPAPREDVYGWLTGPSQDLPTGITVHLREILRSLALWLALSEPRSGSLLAVGDAVERALVPPLLGVGGEQKMATTKIFIAGTGLAALMRPPGQPLRLADPDTIYAGEAPFHLFVRSFGPDVRVAGHLVEQVRLWDAAGRPDGQARHIRVYPHGSVLTQKEGEQIVEGRWNRFVVG